jgi:hypothetical protein
MSAPLLLLALAFYVWWIKARKIVEDGFKTVIKNPLLKTGERVCYCQGLVDDYTAKLSPQAQVRLALGLLK